MKKILIITAVLAALFDLHSAAQELPPQQLTSLATNYYAIRDGLVAGDGNAAKISAGAFIKTANTVDYKIISEGNINALLKDATVISETSDLKKQRIAFANFSNNMIAVAKAVKLTTGPIYVEYCPMKKANWLSNDKQIKNPYYGDAMLSCGKVVETIN